MSVRGSAARIGFLWPVDGLNDDEYWECLPPGVGWYPARYDAGTPDETLTEATIAAYADPALPARAVRLLQAVRPQAVALGDVAASCFDGPAGDRAIRAAVRAAAGVPVASGLSALAAALRAVGARRIALVTPYPADLAGRVEAALRASGLDVTGAASAGSADEFGIGLTPPEVWAERMAAADRPEAEALVLAGGGVRIGRCLAELEERSGKPVVASPQALVWYATRLAGADASRPGFGQLFADHGRTEVSDG